MHVQYYLRLYCMDMGLPSPMLFFPLPPLSFPLSFFFSPLFFFLLFSLFSSFLLSPPFFSPLSFSFLFPFFPFFISRGGSRFRIVPLPSPGTAPHLPVCTVHPASRPKTYAQIYDPKHGQRNEPKKFSPLREGR